MLIEMNRSRPASRDAWIAKPNPLEVLSIVATARSARDKTVYRTGTAEREDEDA